MKLTKVILSSFFVLVLSQQTNASVEVLVSDVLFPATGFDSNDNVEVVVDGQLPNGCYRIAQTNVQRSGSDFRVRQYAELRNVGSCEDLNELPKALDWPVPYSTVVNLGVLSAGDYTVSFPAAKDSEDITVKDLNVAFARSTDVDDYLYAPVTSAFVPELIYKSNDVQVVLTGELGTSCLEVDPQIEFERQGNVLVLLPKLIEKDDVNCRTVRRPIEIIQSLGRLDTGRYLLHVRSTIGNAVNRTFSVIERSTDPTKNR